MSDNNRGGYGIGLGGALFLLFLYLRLTDQIDWAWYWVAAPLWIPLAFLFGLVLIGAGILTIVDIGSKKGRG